MAETNDDRNSLRKQVVLAAGLAIAGIVLGSAGTAYGMLDSFRRIEAMPSPTPADLAVGVHTSFVWAATGCAVALFGVIMWWFAQRRLSRFDQDARCAEDDRS